jgi:ParB family chromosome partitioning protein
MIEMALVENIQRENLNDIEQAVAYQRLMLECGLSHEEISKKVGKSRSAITNFLRLLKLPEDIQNKLRSKEFTMGHARALLAIEDPKLQNAMAQKITAEKMTVRDIERSAQSLPTARRGKKTDQQAPNVEKDPNILQLTEKLRYRFGTMVTIQRKAENKGKIEMHYYSLDDMNRILDLLLFNK